MQSILSQAPSSLLASRGSLTPPLEMGAHAALGTALDASALASLLPAKQPNMVLQYVQQALFSMPMDEGLAAFHGRLQDYLEEMQDYKAFVPHTEIAFSDPEQDLSDISA